MNSVTKTFEDFPVVFLKHEDVSYISHKSLAEYFKWKTGTRKNRFNKVATSHPTWVAYFDTSDRTRVKKFDPSSVGTAGFKKLNDNHRILRCLTRRGLMMTLMQETKHPRAIEFQDFAISALDSLITHGYVRLHEANSLAEQTAKINAENERLKQEIKTLRLQIQRITAESNTNHGNYIKCADRHAWTRIMRLRSIPSGSFTRTSRRATRMKGLVRELERLEVIEWHGERNRKKPYFISEASITANRDLIMGWRL